MPASEVITSAIQLRRHSMLPSRGMRVSERRVFTRRRAVLVASVLKAAGSGDRTPVTSKSTIRALLERSKHNLTVSIPRRITTPSRKLIAIVDDAPLDVSVAVERTVEETTAEIDAIATSINMMPLIDPTFTGFIVGEPITYASKRQGVVITSTLSAEPFITVQFSNCRCCRFCSRCPHVHGRAATLRIENRLEQGLFRTVSR